MTSKREPSIVVFRKHDVSGLHVRQMNSVYRELADQSFHLRPAVFKLLSFFLLPLIHDRRVIGIGRRRIERRARKIENVWRLDHLHFNDKQIVRDIEKLGNPEPANSVDFMFAEAKIDVALPDVPFLFN